MFIVHVFIHVKPGSIEAFKTATLANVRSSIQEPGVARFDFVQQTDDPCRFVIVEAYRTPEDAARHKESAHYPVWRDAVADLMAEPRTSIKYSNIAPADSDWETVGA